MKQVAVASGLTATTMFLQGCEDSNEVNSPAPPQCTELDAAECSKDVNACAWDPETNEESCELEEGAEDWLFSATGEGSFDGCAEYESLPAKQCVSLCEYEPSYKHENSQGENQADLFLRGLDSENFDLSWSAQKVYFYLPKIVDSDISNEGPEFEDDDWKFMDWAAYDEDFSSDLLKCEGYLASTLNGMLDNDPRYDAEAGQTDKLRIFPSQGGANPNQFTCGDQTLAQARDDEQLFVDAGLDAQQVFRRWQYLNSLSTNNEADSISFVQSDLEKLKIVLADPSDQCNSDRNCGLDLASGTCQELITYCDFWSDKSGCFGEQHVGLLPIFTESEDIPDENFDGEVPEGLVRKFAGSVKFSKKDYKCMSATTTDDDIAVCAPHPDYLSCSATPVVAQQGEVSVDPQNFCVDIYAVPVSYDPATSDVANLETFSTNWQVDNDLDSAVNSRGCANFNYSTPGETDGLPSTTYVEGERTGYIGNICTFFADYFCVAESERDSFLPEEPKACQAVTDCPVEDGEDGEYGECVIEEGAEEGVCDFPAADIIAPVEQGPCNNISASICAHTPELNGECLEGPDFYAKYIETPNKVTYEDLSEPEIESDDSSESDDISESDGSDGGDDLGALRA